MPSIMRRLLSEPLLHFLLLGGALFAVFQFTAQPIANPLNADQEIVVTPGRIETLAANFRKVWQRPPTETELNGLVEDFIKEEIYYREALAIGLDQNDTIIRRRLRQKMEFSTTDLSQMAEPTAADLQAVLDANPAAYHIDPIVSFEHIYIDPTKHGDALDGVIGNLRVKIASAENPEELTGLGDRLMMEPAFAKVTVFDIDRLFGQGFGEAVAALELNIWSEPLRSGYGLHFVRVSERIDGRTPALEEVRDELERDWRVKQSAQTEAAFYQALRDRYTITVEDAPALPQ